MKMLVIVLLLFTGSVQAETSCHFMSGMMQELHRIATLSYSRVDFMYQIDGLLERAMIKSEVPLGYDLVDDFYNIANSVYDSRRDFSGLQLKIRFDQTCQAMETNQ